MWEYGDSHIRQGVLRLTVCSFYERPGSQFETILTLNKTKERT